MKLCGGVEMAKAVLSSLEKEYLKTDILIIGSGVAGCSAAIMAAEKGLRVTLVSKSSLGTGGCSRLAGNMSGGPPGQFMSLEERDKLATIAEKTSEGSRQELTEIDKQAIGWRCGYLGFWLMDQDYVLESARRSRDIFLSFLEKRGLYVRRMPDGSVISNKSVVHMQTTWAQRMGMSGPPIMQVLRHEVYGSDVEVKEECMATRLLNDETGKVIGAVALDMRTGKLYIISAKATFMCTGHATYLATRCTASPEETGDGWVMAYRAGAELVNLELHYIHVVDNRDPLTLNIHCYPNPNPRTDMTPHMFDSEGQFFFTPDMFRQGTNAMYHLQMKRVIKKIYEGRARADGGYYSSYKHMLEYMDPEFTWQKKVYDKLGYNIAVEPIENCLNWEFSMGGINCNMKTLESNLPGLYGVGGAGRQAGFSGCIPAAAVAVDHAAKKCEQVKVRDPDPNQVASEEARLLSYLRTEPQGGYKPAVLQTEARKILYDNLVPIKNEEKMKKGLAELRKIKEEMVPKMALESTSLNYNVGWINAINLDTMLEAIELQFLTSIERKESRGPFFREDYPYTDNENWLVSNILKLVDGKPKFRQEPVELKYVGPAEKKADYFKVIY